MGTPSSSIGTAICEDNVVEVFVEFSEIDYALVLSNLLPEAKTGLTSPSSEV